MTATRKARLANDYRELMSMQGPVLKVKPLSGEPPYVDEYELTINLRSIIGPEPTYRGVHVIRLSLPSGYPLDDFPRVVMVIRGSLIVLFIILIPICSITGLSSYTPKGESPETSNMTIEEIEEQHRKICRNLESNVWVKISDQEKINTLQGICDYECSIMLQDIESVLEYLSSTVKEYMGNMRVDINAFHICILDSHDEGICQAVEKNIETIAKAKLTQVMAGEISLDEIRLGAQYEEFVPIYPLPADESQKKVVDSVLKGQSIYAPAPAGAGKSQTSVNIAANLAIQGKSICVMSEKLAANEVFLDYATKIGLDKYCLSINSNMKTADIVKQIKAIVKISRQFVHTSLAKETVGRYNEAVREYERLNRELYRTDTVLNASLYELISTAISAPEMTNFNIEDVNKKDYFTLRGMLLDINSSCFEIMTDSEFDDFFYYNSCADLELQSILNKSLNRIKALGLDLTSIIPQNNLNRDDAIKSILANFARKLALDIIGEHDLFEIGNRKVKAVYKTLVETHLQMQQLYVSYMHQELSARIADNIDDKFIATLEKLKVTKVTPQELFAAYGKEILAICPIIITTPTAASNYIYGTGMDDFHTMIIDEASQMQIISILPYMDRTKQLVVFGDHMQLGITSTFMKKDVAIGTDFELKLPRTLQRHLHIWYFVIIALDAKTVYPILKWLNFKITFERHSNKATRHTPPNNFEKCI